jgi:hypothetical protein
MEIVFIKAQHSAGLERYALVLDGLYVDLGADNQEYAVIQGHPNDGLQHFISYTLFGSTGDTLSFEITHQGREIAKIEEAKIFPGGGKYASGELDFSL